MPQPLVVSVSHHLRKDEAVRRLKHGLSRVHTNFGHLFIVENETWNGDQLQFGVRALGQVVSGKIVVFDDRVCLEVMLPWLLAKLASAIQPLVRKEGLLMLEKK